MPSSKPFPVIFNTTVQICILHLKSDYLQEEIFFHVSTYTYVSCNEDDARHFLGIMQWQDTLIASLCRSNTPHVPIPRLAQCPILNCGPAVVSI